MKYVVDKPLVLGGFRYVSGDIVDSDKIKGSRLLSLVKNGYLTKLPDVDNKLQEEDGMMLGIHILQEDKEVSITTKEVVKILEILQLSADDAVSEIKMINKMDVLEIIKAVDSRKAVSTAVKKQMESI